MLCSSPGLKGCDRPSIAVGFHKSEEDDGQYSEKQIANPQAGDINPNS